MLCFQHPTRCESRIRHPMRSVLPFDAWFHPMRSLFAGSLEALSLYLRDIPTTDILSIFWVVMAIWLFRITNIQSLCVVAVPSMPGVPHTVVMLETPGSASIETCVDCGIIRQLKACVECCIPVLALREVAVKREK
jgi:hypothetical protein